MGRQMTVAHLHCQAHLPQLRASYLDSKRSTHSPHQVTTQSLSIPTTQPLPPNRLEHYLQVPERCLHHSMVSSDLPQFTYII